MVGFNLVIERLLVSSEKKPIVSCHSVLFQSRNREAFGFKEADGGGWKAQKETSFNLVIERLLVSSERELTHTIGGSQFQSRNREAFGFKDKVGAANARLLDTFQSRNREAFGFKPLNVFLSAGFRKVSIS